MFNSENVLHIVSESKMRKSLYSLTSFKNNKEDGRHQNHAFLSDEASKGCVVL